MSAESSKCAIYFPPKKPNIDRPSVVLYGTIESDSNNNWTTRLSAGLSSLPIAVLNPRRDDWDSSWKEDVSCDIFKEQVEWELYYAGVADVIVFYFKPGSDSPVTLLEFGLHAGRYPTKSVVCCPRGFSKRGNVEIVCGQLGVPFVENLEELELKTKEKLEAILKEKDTAQ